MPDLALGIGHGAAEVAGEFGLVGGAHPCGSGVGVWMSLPARRELVCRGREGLFVGKAGPSPGAARLPLPLRRRGAVRSLEARCFSPSPAQREREARMRRVRARLFARNKERPPGGGLSLNSRSEERRGGKSGAVRVNLGGRRSIKKKKN